MSQFGSFGIANKRLWVKPGRLKGIVIGEYGVGKTSFLGSNPAALIVNLDRSSTPVPLPDSPGLPAQMWPAMSPDGALTNVDGTPADLSLDSLWKLHASLVEAAAKNLPRPETICLDSITEFFAILRVGTLKHFKKATWDEGHGESMWEWLYQQLTSYINGLLTAGYGVWLTAHIAPEYVTEDDGKKKTRWALTTPPGFFKRFYGSFELAVEVQKSFRPKQVVNKRTIKVNGVDRTIEEPATINEAVFTLIGENPERGNLYKRRVCFPKSLELTPPNMWARFEEEYLKVAVPPAIAPK